MNLDKVTVVMSPDDLPDDIDTLDDGVYITSAVFAHLMNDDKVVKPDSFQSMKSRAWKRHNTPAQRPGDIPYTDTRLGRSPVWSMGVFREWKTHRPGQGTGGGRRKGFRPPPTRVRLPHDCPHCGHGITGKDVQAQEGAKTAPETPAVPKAAGARKGRRTRAVE